MKRLLAILVLLSVPAFAQIRAWGQVRVWVDAPPPSGGGSTYVNSCSLYDGTYGAAANCSPGGTGLTAGNTAIVACTVTNYATHYLVTDNASPSSNTYTQVGVATDASGLSVGLYYAKNVSAATTITCKPLDGSEAQVNSGDKSIAVAQFSGLSTTAPLDPLSDSSNYKTGTTSSGTTVTSTSLTTTATNSVIIAAAATYAVSSVSPGAIAGTTATMPANPNGLSGITSGNSVGPMEYRIVSATTTGTAAMSSGSSSTWAIIAAAFK